MVFNIVPFIIGWCHLDKAGWNMFIAVSGILRNTLVLLLAYQMFSMGEMLQEGGVFSVVILDLAWHWEEIWRVGEPKTTGNVFKRRETDTR